MSTLPHVLLTGGTGFFGRALLRNWLAKFCAGEAIPLVTILTRTPAVFLNKYPEFSGQPWLRLHTGNILEPHTLPLHDSSFTQIIHAAADSTFGPQLTPLQRYDQIVNGTRNMLDFALICGAQRFLFTSSGGIYGVQPENLNSIPENWHGSPDPLNPASAYSIAKLAAEHLCILYTENYGLNAVIARCFAFIGQDLPLDVHFAIGNFIRDALWLEKITVVGDGTPLRSYLDQRDLASWLLTIMERGKSGQAYNVGSDQAISIGDLAYLVRDIIAPTKIVYILGETNEENTRNTYIPSIKKARVELGLELSITLAEAIRTTANTAMQRVNFD